MGSNNQKSKKTNISIEVKVPEGTTIETLRIDEHGSIHGLDPQGKTIELEGLTRKVYHDRPKGPKIRSRQNLQSGSGAIGGLLSLSNYDVIFVIDTNTKKIGKSTVSVSGFIPIKVILNDGLYQVKCLDSSVNIYEFHGNLEKPELFAISKLIADLSKAETIQKVAIVSDSELGFHEEYNSRKRPVYGDLFLPENFSILYASSDTGWEILNKFIRVCDKQASNHIIDLECGNIPEAPLVQMENNESIRIRVGRRNATITIESSNLDELKLTNGETVTLYGLPKK